jgi:hypothetical protein
MTRIADTSLSAAAYRIKTGKITLQTLWTASHNAGARSGHNPPRDLTFASLALAPDRPQGIPQGQG